MKGCICKEFQETVQQYLIRHRSILDILSKSHHANSKVNRMVTKAITQCGCLEIEGKKVEIPEDATMPEFSASFNTHLKGRICENCQEVIEQELGRQFFYLAALCNVLDLDLDEVIRKENAKVLALRHFNFT